MDDAAPISTAPGSGVGVGFDDIARFVLTRGADDMPETCLNMAALLLLDTLGVAIAAQPMEAGRIARDTACAIYGAGTPPETAAHLFDGRTTSIAGAAFAAATQIDNLDGHDGYNPTKGHIGVVAVAALAALAQRLPDLGGRDALAAMIVCYEVAGRAGIALHATVADYHTSGAWNALGVAAMAARLRGLPPEVLRHAFGIAEYHGPRSQMMREIANPTMLHDGSGQGALVGVTAAVMAAMGFTGAPAITLEAPDASPHWADLGRFWQIEHQYIKPYPICRWAHAAIDAAREICAAHDLTADDVAAVEIASFRYATQLFPGMPDTTSQAQYSLPFAVATMIAHQRIDPGHIAGEGLRDPRVARLVAATSLREEARHEARYPGGRWADVTLVTSDGRRLASGDVHARGGPERPFDAADIVAKFEAYATPVLGPERTAAIRDAALGLTGRDRPFADLMGHLTAPP